MRRTETRSVDDVSVLNDVGEYLKLQPERTEHRSGTG